MKKAYCDGIRRRDFLRVGAAGALGVNLPLAQLLAAEPKLKGNDTNFIFVFLKGGMSTIDTFDLKPNAPEDVRGPFGSIPTNLPGVRVGEGMRELAPQAERLWLGERTGAQQPRAEALPLDQLEDDEGLVVLGARGQDGHDMGVAQARQHTSLAQEPSRRSGVSSDARWQHLDRHAPVQRILPGVVDDPHPPAPDKPAKRVVAEGAEG